MKKEIPENIIKETTLCEKLFDCLNSEDHVYCNVEECINDKIHFIKCLHNDYCIYKIPFGNSHCCRCPTRKETRKRRSYLAIVSSYRFTRQKALAQCASAPNKRVQSDAAAAAGNRAQNQVLCGILH